MGERRSSEFGTAQPYTFLTYFGIGTNRKEPNPEKFEGKWFSGQDKLEIDEFIVEKYAPSIAEIPQDNVTWRKRCVDTATLQLAPASEGPRFSDFRYGAYQTGMDSDKYQRSLHDQLNHCIGSLGEDHPTCAKARWYFKSACAPGLGSHLEDMEELGHFDLAKKWGVKSSRSFLPRYQPVKKNIPGAYEYYRSEEYLENRFDGEEGDTWPIALLE